MRLPRLTTRRLTVLALLGVVAMVAFVPWTFRKFDRWGARLHQKAVTRELASWASKYGRVHDDREAEHAIDMLEYVRSDYVPIDPGYRSDPPTEAALEAQRARTLAAIAAGLRSYTGRDFGGDAGRWRVWWQGRQESPGTVP